MEDVDGYVIGHVGIYDGELRMWEMRYMLDIMGVLM